MPTQFSRVALKFGRMQKVGRELMRVENTSLPRLQRKVIIGRVTSVDNNGYYNVESGFKRQGEVAGSTPSRSNNDPLTQPRLCTRPPPRCTPPKKPKIHPFFFWFFGSFDKKKNTGAFAHNDTPTRQAIPACRIHTRHDRRRAVVTSSCFAWI
jgi:hypothetical protein